MPSHPPSSRSARAVWPLGLQRVVVPMGGGRLRELRVSGPLPARPRVAVVGSRAALMANLALTPDVVGALMAGGWALVSGGAIGVDIALHREALARGCPQVAVLPLGPDEVYPRHHLSTFVAMARAPSCSVAFARAPGARPSRASFASRNQVILGLVERLIVIQAASRSGSCGTGLVALARGIPTAALTGSLGCDALVAAGARGLSRANFAVDLAGFLADETGDETAHRADTPWPAALSALGERLRAAGPQGLDIAELSFAESVASVHAERLGLIVRPAAGRIAAAGAAWARRLC